MDAGKEGCGFELKMKQPKLILLPFARKHRINIVLAGLLTCFLKCAFPTKKVSGKDAL